jgi:hypothetical protein
MFSFHPTQKALDDHRTLQNKGKTSFPDHDASKLPKLNDEQKENLEQMEKDFFRTREKLCGNDNIA